MDLRDEALGLNNSFSPGLIISWPSSITHCGIYFEHFNIDLRIK